MSFLTGQGIVQAVHKGQLTVEPFVPERIRAGALQLTLGPEITSPRAEDCTEPLDVRDIVSGRMPEAHKVSTEGFLLQPGEYVQAKTCEMLALPPDMAAFAFSLSELGSCGLLVAVSPVLQPGFCGQVPLSLHNCSHRAIRLACSVPVCRVLFMPGAETAAAARSSRQDMLDFIREQHEKHQAELIRQGKLKVVPADENSLSAFMDKQLRKLAGF